LVVDQVDKFSVHTGGDETATFGSSGRRDDYLLTSPGSINGTISYLNNNPLQLTPNGDYPEISPVEIVDAAATPLVIPPQSYGFFVFPDAALAACNPSTY